MLGPKQAISKLFSVFNNKSNRAPSQDSTYSSAPMMLNVYRPTAAQFTAKLYNQIAIDVASVDFRHITVDADGRYVENVDSSLADCMRFKPNLDQTWANFIQDVVWTMLEYGSAAIVAVDTTENPETSESYDVITMRVGSISKWMAQHVQVSLYNEQTGRREEITVAKSNCAIVANPQYMIMNQPTADLKRLLHKLSILDAIDDASANNKLDIIIQLPYAVGNDRREAQASRRQRQISDQLRTSEYGVAWIDGTEKITQLNRPATNNLMDQITWLTNQVYSTLGVTPEVFEGKATELQMLAYRQRTIDPILREIATCLTVAFLSKNARTRGHRIQWFRDPFSLVPASQFGDLAQSLKSAEIASGNELRPAIGLKQFPDPKADELNNSNINTTEPPSVPKPRLSEPSEEVQNGR